MFEARTRTRARTCTEGREVWLYFLAVAVVNERLLVGHVPEAHALLTRQLHARKHCSTCTCVCDQYGPIMPLRVTLLL